MEKPFQKFSGLSLIISSVLLVFTMVLHPTGGNTKHILQMHDVAIIAHSLAIITLPFVAFGFYGLSIILLTNHKISLLAFIFVCFALLAGMIAASINGLILPMFVENYAQEFEQNSEVLRPILKYGSFFNIAMDNIMIVGIVVAITIWSVLIIISKKLPQWMGYYGLVLLLLSLLGVILNFNFVNLFGFRMFIFGLVSWIVVTGWLMMRETNL
ncbi:MAG: hypothetical protein MUF58_20435 [Arcicella sp.]|jgi:hypothetical protein|nr:hypothetical protein [Arcicella sp.]